MPGSTELGKAPDPSPSRPNRATVSGEREVFLDAVRAIAILRVIAWHAFGIAAITYVVAAIPAMFFVTGSLLAKSFRRRSAPRVLLDRFRRLLIPLWVFGLVAWVAMAVAAHHQGTSLPWHRVLAWVVPFVDPHGTHWEGGWMSSHLWYLRCLTWLLLASPLLIRVVRAWRWAALAVPVAGVFVLDVLARRGPVFPFGPATWGAGDLLLYAVFLMAGFLHRDGAFARVRRRGWLAVALVAGAGAVVWRLTQPVPLGVVNNSHPMHLFVGTAWLAVAMAAQPALTRLALSPVVGAAVRAIGRRSLTIYLWHTAAVILALNLLEARHIDDPVAHAVGLILLTAVGVVIAVRLVGWVEDFAARRPLRRERRPDESAVPRIVAFAALVTVTAGVVFTSGTTATTPRFTANTAEAASAPRPSRPSSHRPPAPSKAPPAPSFHASAKPPPPEELTPEVTDKLVGQLDGVFQQWADETGVTAALAGVTVGPDIRWTGALGHRPDSEQAVTVKDQIDLASLTKLFTASLVHRYAEAGMIDLFAPIPPIKSLPDFPYDLGITPAELLDHTSGLVNYRDTAAYQRDPDSIDSPVAAVMASVAEPLASWPGTSYSYSSTNYLILGLLLEEVTGRSYDALLRDDLIAPLGLHETIHRPPGPSEPRGGTAGLVMTLPDLLNAGVAILRDHVGISDQEYAFMTDVDVNTSYGPGTFGFCPCRIDAQGTPQFFAIGYFGASAMLAYAPSIDLTLAIDLVDAPAQQDYFAPVPQLFEMIEDVLRRS